MKVVAISQDNYPQFYSLTQTLVQGPMLLPMVWQDCLWGVLAYSDDNKLLAGWVGRKRLSGWKARLYQEIVFDSMPQVFSDENRTTYDSANSPLFDALIQAAITKGKREHIAALIITHWSRTKFEWHDKNFIPEENATFINNLQQDNLIMTLDSSLRNKIRKAEKSGVQFIVYSKDEAIQMLPRFQSLRAETQARAVERNEGSSMLLKSESYYKNILENYDSTLVAARTADGEIASMTLCIKSGKTMYTYYSGSDIEQNRKTGCSAYLKWKIFELAARQGCTQVDMSGVPVNPTPDHPAYGVYRFKASYSGDYQQFRGGVFLLLPIRYRLVGSLKTNRHLLRLLSKRM